MRSTATGSTTACGQGFDDLQGDVTEADPVTFIHLTDRVRGLGGLATTDPRLGRREQFEMPGDEVGMEEVDHASEGEPMRAQISRRSEARLGSTVTALPVLWSGCQ